MPTADEVIVEFEARVGQYEADLRRSAATFERVTQAQQRQMIALERQISASSGKIGSAFKGLASLFGASQVAKLSDDYTRLQNSLKVAGLEGEALEAVQSRLLDLGGKYGVSVNTLAELYGNLSQVSGELGATQAQVLKINEAVAQSLIVTGKSSQEASGAVLGLVQAFGNGKLQAEEWAQINEGGLRPLLEAAAAADKYGGSVQKLRKAVYDGKVSSQEFFQAILDGSGVIETKAATATLTLEGAYAALNNRLIEFVGSAASTSGAAGALASGIQALAENLGTVSAALAVIATILGVRYVGASVAAGVATVALSAANTRAALTAEALSSATFQANAALLGQAAASNIATASVTRLSVAQATAARTGGALTALVGGPYGAAILALGAGIYALSQYTEGAAEETDEYRAQVEAGAKADKEAEDIALRLAGARGQEKVAAEAAARAEIERTKRTIEATRADLTAAKAALEKARAYQAAQNTAAMSAGGTVPGGTAGIMRLTGERAVNQATNIMAQQQKLLDQSEARLKNLEGAIKAPSVSAAVAADDKKKKAGRTRSGPAMASAADQQRELDRIALEELQARLDLAVTAEARADFQRQILEKEKAMRIADIQADERFTAAQKAAQIKALEKLYGPEANASGEITVSPSLLGRAIDLERARNQAREAQDIADEQFRAQQEILRNQYDLADSSAERKRLALASIELEDRYQRAQLQAIIDLEGANSAAGKRAQVALDAQAEITSGRKAIAARSNQSPLEAYRDRLDRDPGETKDLVESYVVDELNMVRDSISSAIQKRLGVKDPLIAGLLNLFIEDVIMKPLAEALKGASGGGGAGGIFSAIGSALGSVFGGGRAIGGPVKAGVPYKVGESGQEMFVPQQAGVIVPNHALKGGRGATIINQSFTLDARGGITTPELLQYVNDTARENATQAAGASYAAGQQSTPGTLNKFTQLRG